MVERVSERRKLSRELIVATARGLADRAGLAALTLRELAQQLNTGQSSLYRHVADRRELLGLLADDVAAGYPTQDPNLPLPERLVRVWQEMYAYLRAHRWVATVIIEGDLTSRHAVPFAERQRRTFVEAGLSVTEANRAYHALFNLTLGYLLNQPPMPYDRACGGEHGVAESSGEGEFDWAVRGFVTSLLATALTSAVRAN